MLDRRRLEDAHMIYAVLHVLNWYPAKFRYNENRIRPSHFNEVLSCVTPIFHNGFSERYAGMLVTISKVCYTIILSGHKCDVLGCNSVLVMDGNLKNHRDVCLAKEAGYVTYQGLPGKVKTGCVLTPDLRSRYCSLHKPRVCEKPQDDDTSNSEEDIAEMIVEERITRSQTHYKV